MIEIEWFGRTAVVSNVPESIEVYDLLWACDNVEREGDGVYRFDNVYPKMKKQFVAVFDRESNRVEKM